MFTRSRNLAGALMVAIAPLDAVIAQTPKAPDLAPAIASTGRGIKPSEVVVPFSRRIDFTSKVNGQSYTLYVAIPTTPAPKEGYPVVYVLDGVAYFGSATEAARGGNLGIVVVGVGYPFDDPDFIAKTIKKPKAANGEVSLLEIGPAIQVTRTLDLTPPTSEAFMKAQKIPGFNAMKAGGTDAFLQVIETEIKPRVHALLKVDAGNEALYGHSLGGLAVVRALFTEPAAFRTFIAASPSIWWNDRSVLEGEGSFASKVSSGAVAPRVLITVGGLEQTPAPIPPGMGLTQADADAMTATARMVDNAKDLGARLGALKGGPGYEVRTVVFSDETHGSVEQAAVSRGVNYAAKGAPLKP